MIFVLYGFMKEQLFLGFPLSECFANRNFHLECTYFILIMIEIGHLGFPIHGRNAGLIYFILLYTENKLFYYLVVRWI